ncbi:phospholipase A2 group XV-like [Gigantopelta aegis]|uniref:phospholipase A2 group XV-like n=1 Tax=Gigantopelta aegis TaxID=1735272 RepID=UPI001B88E67C|nr:phospholipase A2 group XV-like [Gigantopelta aegis]
MWFIKLRLCSCSSFLLILILICPSLGKPKNPVILVPGDGGSQILAKLNKSSVVHYICEKTTADYYSLWLNLEMMIPEVIDCFVDNMRLVYHPENHTTSNSPGVDTKIPGFGKTEHIEWLDPDVHVHYSSTSYYNPIVEALVLWGYERDVSIRGAPYDFRKAPNELGQFFFDFQLLVEDTYVKNNNSKVIVLAHSMGNANMLYFFNQRPQSWKDKFIKFWISLSGVWAGAVKPLRLMASGDSLNIPLVSAMSIRIEQRSMMSTAFLMPSDKFWGNNEVLVSRPGKNYTVNDYEQFFKDLFFSTGYSMRKDVDHLIRDLKPPMVDVYCLHGTNVSTPGMLNYSEGQWPDSQPTVVPDNGDGTVNIRSLQGCLAWQKSQKVVHKVFNKVEHTEILMDKDVIDYLKTILKS